MIRREVSENGEQFWAIIPQTEHARVAGELACSWKLPTLAPALRDELLWVVTHHDDGWAEWDANPQLDPQGRPFSFLEMRPEDSWRIWGASIDIAQQRSPLAAYLVARHFLEMTADGAENDPFHQRHAARCDVDLQVWLESDSGRLIDVDQTEQAADLLRAFDWLSLLICCGITEEALPISFPNGDIVFDSQCLERPRLEPWPLRVDSCQLSVCGWKAPIRAYSSVNDLKRQATELRLMWTLASSASAD